MEQPYVIRRYMPEHMYNTYIFNEDGIFDIDSKSHFFGPLVVEDLKKFRESIPTWIRNIVAQAHIYLVCSTMIYHCGVTGEQVMCFSSDWNNIDRFSFTTMKGEVIIEYLFWLSCTSSHGWHCSEIDVIKIYNEKGLSDRDIIELFKKKNCSRTHIADWLKENKNDKFKFVGDYRKSRQKMALLAGFHPRCGAASDLAKIAKRSAFERQIFRIVMNLGC